MQKYRQKNTQIDRQTEAAPGEAFRAVGGAGPLGGGGVGRHARRGHVGQTGFFLAQRSESMSLCWFKGDDVLSSASRRFIVFVTPLT